MAESCSQNATTSRDGKTVYTGSAWKPVTYKTEDGMEKKHYPAHRLWGHKPYH